MCLRSHLVVAITWSRDIMTVTMEFDEELPDFDAAKEFYAKYEPKEVLGK